MPSSLMLSPDDFGEAAVLQRVLDAQPGIAYVYDLVQRRNLFVSSQWARDFGYSVEETQAAGSDFVASLLHPEDYARAMDHLAELAVAADDAPRVFEYRMRRADGTWVWLASHDRPLVRDAHGRVVQIVGFARDITQQKTAEKEQIASEALFRMMVDNLPDAIFITDLRGQILRVNEGACRQLGYSREELDRLNITSVIAPHFRERAKLRLSGALGQATAFDSAHLRKDGSQVPVETVVVRIELGGQSAYLGVARDISERKAGEERLLRESALRAAIINNAVEGVCVCEEQPEPPGLRFSVWNQQMEEITGYTLDEINELGWYQTVYRERETQERAINRMDRMRRGEDLEAEEWVITRKDGTKRNLLISTRVLRDTGKTPQVLGVMHDVTQRVALEARLRDAERMEAIGRLAGAVAHDFNNLLAAILGGASLLRDSENLSEGNRALADDIVLAATRGSDLTRQLLTFSRRQRVEMVPLDMAELCRKTLRVIQRLLGGDVRTELILEPHCVVRGDPGMLDQVIMNLAINARDAMPKGGLLTISLEKAASPEVLRGSIGPRVILRVEDTGSGVPPEVLPHLFEPFFTTRASGGGTGMGLATVYGIVTHHGGTIDVQSVVGSGTTFRISLPLAESAAVGAMAARAAPRTPPQVILLVEDQGAVRRTVTRMLELMGHRVHAAETAREALALWDHHKAEISLLLSDVALGGDMTGPEVAARIKAQQPALPVVFMSGFDESLAQLPLAQGHDFLQKPFQAAELQALLAQRCVG